MCVVLSLTLADLGGEGEGILHALPDMARNFDNVSARPRHERNLMAPYFTANRCDGVAEGQECFWIPGGGSGGELSRFCEVVRQQCDDGKQGEQRRRGSKDCFIGPLPLGFDTEMGAGFFEGNLDLPARHEPGEDVARTGIEIGGEESLRFEFALGIAHEQPADWHWRCAGAIPDGGAAGDFDEAVGSTVPQADTMALPGEFGIGEDGGELFQALAFDRRPTAAFAFWWWEGEQVGIEPQPGDDADMVANRGEEFDGRERTVGDQHNVAIRKPAVDLQGGLPGPIEQRLLGTRLAFIEALGGSKQGEEGQRHDAIGPWHPHQQHGGKPAQTACFDEVTFGGADRIAIDATGADLGAQRRSMVSSSPITTGAPAGTNALTSRSNSRPAAARDDHVARLRIR